MTDLHQRLLHDIYIREDPDGLPADAPVRALRAVVERHAPIPCGWRDCKSPDTHRVCQECGSAHNYPCPTVVDVLDGLGIEYGVEVVAP